MDPPQPPVSAVRATNTATAREVRWQVLRWYLILGPLAAVLLPLTNRVPLFWGGLFFAVGFSMLVVPALVAALAIARKSLPQYVQVDTSGLTLGLTDRVVLRTWDQVQAVEFGDDRVVIRCEDTLIELGPAYDHAWPLANVAARRLGSSSPATEEVPDDDNAGLLVAVSERTARAETPFRTYFGWTLFQSLFPAYVLSLGSIGGPGISAWAWWAAAAVAAYQFMVAAPKEWPGFVTAYSLDRAGLTVRYPRYCVCIPWHEIRNVAVRGRRHQVQTLRGEYALPQTPAGKRIAYAIEEVLNARREGHPLPRIAFTPDGAISPVTDSSTRAEVGLSRADPPEDDAA